MKFLDTAKKFGAIAAVAFALASPILAAAPANAEPFRTERVQMDRDAHAMNGE